MGYPSSPEQVAMATTYSIEIPRRITQPIRLPRELTYDEAQDIAQRILADSYGVSRDDLEAFASWATSIDMATIELARAKCVQPDLERLAETVTDRRYHEVATEIAAQRGRTVNRYCWSATVA